MSLVDKPQQDQDHNGNEDQHQNVNEQNNMPAPKKLRRVAERQQMPSDKAQLIQYLTKRIQQAEDALTDTEELLQSQVTERQKISKSINERNQQLEKLYEVDQKALPQKIKQKLTSILTETINQKVEAQESLNQEKSKNYEYKSRYNELKFQGQKLTAKLQQQSAKQQFLSGEINKIEARCQNHQLEISELAEQFQKVKSKKDDMQNKYLQLKVALDRMNDVRSVLNRFFGNQDLFDQKMDLKQQKITKLTPPPIIRDQRVPSRQTKGGNQPRLKPIQRQNRNDDQDFWKGDFSRSRPSFG